MRTGRAASSEVAASRRRHVGRPLWPSGALQLEQQLLPEAATHRVVRDLERAQREGGDEARAQLVLARGERWAASAPVCPEQADEGPAGSQHGGGDADVGGPLLRIDRAKAAVLEEE